METVVEISDDVVVEILSRLPVKSLLRFRCVCKLWHRIISDSSFIEQHRSLSLTRAGGNFLLLFFPDAVNWPREVVLSIDNSEEEGRCHACRHNFYLYSHSECINGIMCLNYPKPMVCNLSSKESLLLPPTSLMEVPEWVPPFSRCFLGFDHRTNTYKILRAWRVYRSFVGWIPCYEVITLGTDSNTNAWRSVIPDYSDSFLPEESDSVCVRGTMYWITSSGNNVVAFDVAEERFQLFPSPSRTIHSAVVELDGRPAMVSTEGLVDGGGDSISVWVLEVEGDGDRIWCKEEKIVFPAIWGEVKQAMPSFCQILVTTRGRELLLFLLSASSAELCVVYYDIQRKRMRFKSLVKPQNGVGCSPSVCNYVESLVSFKEIN